MSTFDGIVEEFPNIRIDYFRQHLGQTPPAACFLSHVHSDHLQGLETLRMPFVYCSAATRRLLLKMEKYPHRINFSKGILEARKQTYKHLKLILRPLPLHSPVDLELGPKIFIRVTLFDANHCPGAVMFLIEGDGKAVVYTGDIRAEPWWVNSIVRNPILLPFATGQKPLDCMYLDTTFASRQDIHREFPTKAEGLAELSKKVAKCDNDSVFYFRAWTLGYEDVWLMLSSMLNSQVHVDRYQMQLFRGIAEDGLGADAGPVLTGFQVGNGQQPGCLTTESAVRIHSCEPGMPCHTSLKKSENIVWITPIISRLRDGTEIAEVGAGGGKADLYQQREVELGDESIMEGFRMLCQTLAADTDAAAKLETALTKAQYHREQRVALDDLDLAPKAQVTITEFLQLLASKNSNSEAAIKQQQVSSQNVIHFPYSRHSSYSELRHLIEAFKPKDLCPCTVDLNNWDEQEFSMESLFGDICSGKIFKYDKEVKEEVERRRAESRTTSNDEETQKQRDTQRTEDTESVISFQDLVDVSLSAQKLQQPSTRVAIEPLKSTEHQQGAPTVQVKIATDKAFTEADPDRRTPKQRMRDAWRAANSGSDTYYPKVVPKKRCVGERTHATPEEVSRCNVPSYLGNTIDSMEEQQHIEPNTMKVQDTLAIETDGASPESSDCDLESRLEAFLAARKCLLTSDASEWLGLRIECLGRNMHTGEEVEL